MNDKKKVYESVLNEIKTLNNNNKIKQPRKRNLYGVSLFPFVWSPNYNFKEESLIYNQTVRNYYANYVEGENGGLILLENELNDLNKNKMLDKSINEIKYISYRKKINDLIARKLLKFSNYYLSSKNISSSSNKDLWSYYLLFKEIYEEYEFNSNIWFMIADEYYIFVEQKLLNLNMNKSEIDILLTPSFISLANQETIELYNIIDQINSNKRLKEKLINNKDINAFKKSPIYEFIQKIVKKFYWLPFSHNGPDLYDDEHYIKQIINYFSSNHKENIGEKIKFNLNSLIKDKNKIINKYNLDKTTLLILKNLEILYLMQDERKKTISESHISWTNNLMNKIGKEMGLSPQESANLLPDEIKQYLLFNKIDLKEYYKRKNAKFIFYILNKKKLYYYIDDEALEIKEILFKENTKKYLIGTIASSGIVEANAKVILNIKDFDKVNNGDIIITTMTTPDFIPVLRKAKGVITEEGGVTCHAAIITRELKIPCIINVKNITTIIKDGDKILLDANNNKIIVL